MTNIYQTPFVDAGRIIAIRQALTGAYEQKDREAVKNAAKEAQAYIDEGGDVYDINEELEDYQGAESWKLTDKYLLRLLHDRHLDYDEDQEYIATGLMPFMRKWKKEPIQLSLFD